MMEKNELSQRLINNELISHRQPSAINKEWLRQLFQEKNMFSAKSWQMIKDLCGLNSLAKLIKTDLNDGIPGTQNDISWREQQFGSNKLVRLPQLETFWTFFNKFFHNKYFFHLLLVSLLSYVLNVCLKQNYGQSLLILMLLIALGLFYAFYMISIFNYNDSNKILTKQSNFIYIQFIKRWSSMSVRVKRNGIVQTRKITECLTGDIILVKSGDTIPANGVIIKEKSFSVTVINSAHSQEKKSFTTQSKDNMKDKYFVHSLSQVKSGQATILLIDVGFSKIYFSFQNQIKNQQRKCRSKLNERINSMQTYFDGAKFRIFSLMIISLIVKLLWQIFMTQKLDWLQTFIKVIEVYQISFICLVIGSFNVLKVGQNMFLSRQLSLLKKFDISIKHSSVIQNARYLTDICLSNSCINSGILKIKNIMIGQEVIYDSTNLSVSYLKQKTNKKWRDLFLYLLCSTQKLRRYKQFAKLFLELGYPYHEIQQIQSTAIQHPNKNLRYKLVPHNGKKIVAIEADFQDVFAYCTGYTDKQGEIKLMSNELINKIKQSVTLHQLHKSCRVRVICYKPINSLQTLFNQHQKHQFLESSLILVGLINFCFQIYHEVSSSFKIFTANKIKIKFLSGNNLQTCVSLAKQVQILPMDFELSNDQQIAIQSAQMLRILHETGFSHEKNSCNDMQRLRKFVKNVKVIARITIYDERIFINALKMAGSIIGTICLQDKQIIDLACISLTNVTDNQNLAGNVFTLFNRSSVYGMEQLFSSNRTLNIYLSKLFKLAQTSKLVAICLIFLYALLFSRFQLQFSVSIMVLHSGILLFYSSLLRFINIDHALQKSMRVPILNQRNKKAIFLIVVAQVAIFIGLICFAHRSLPHAVDEQYDNQMIKYSWMLARCYLFFQYFHFISALKQNNLQHYFPQLNSQSLSLFVLRKRKIIVKALFIYLNLEVVLFAIRVIAGQEIHALAILTSEIGGKLYMCCLMIGLFLLYVDYVVDLFHWERLWGQYYPSYFQHLFINQVVQMIEL